jgi:hypothetical protein
MKGDNMAYKYIKKESVWKSGKHFWGRNIKKGVKKTTKATKGLLNY